MNKNLSIFVLLLFCSLHAMKRPGEEQEAPAAKAPRVPEQPVLSEETQKHIKQLQEMAQRGEFPNEIGARILINLVKEKVRGATQEQRLYNAVANIRAFMEAFPQFYGDVQVNGAIIQELAARYAQGDTIRVAVALATTGAGQWLRAYVGNDATKRRNLGIELVRASEKGDLGTIRFIIAQIPDVINQTYYAGVTALMLAAQNGHIAIVERLLQVPGINVNAQTQQGITALMFAAENGHTAIVERLLQVPGINVNLQNQERVTALMFAAHNGHTAIVERLLQVPGINVNIQDQRGRTALMLAAKNGHTAGVERLLQVPGINVNAQTQNGMTALMIAAQHGHTAIVERLLQMPGINVNLQNQQRATALMFAARNGHAQVVERLLQVPGINVNARFQYGFTALRFVRESNNPNKEAIIKLLISHGGTE